jgi:hypothetical protein
MSATQSVIDWKHLDFPQFLGLIPTEEVAFKFAVDFGLVDKERECECGARMTMQAKSSERYGVQFVCSAGKSKCRKTKSILVDSWFFNSKLSIRTALLCIAAYANSLSTSQFAFFTGMSIHL